MQDGANRAGANADEIGTHVSSDKIEKLSRSKKKRSNTKWTGLLKKTCAKRRGRTLL